MKKLLIEDETVLEMISQLNLIISSCSLTLPELIKELQTHLRYIIMGMPVSYLVVSVFIKVRYFFFFFYVVIYDLIQNKY